MPLMDDRRRVEVGRKHVFDLRGDGRADDETPVHVTAR